MEFGFTEGQERLRREIHDFFLNELPDDFESSMAVMTEEQQSFMMGLQKKAGKKGWLSAGWPEKYGGMGFTPIEQAIVLEEQGYQDILWLNNIGLRLSAPAVLLFGTEEQKEKFIPPIARGEQIWIQAFTEPDAGSDEANVQLRAVPDGDGFILNGQKTFITTVAAGDYVYTLARTADVIPKHRGLSLFLVPADLPGITFRPLPCMGLHPCSEIFFDDVRVSKEYLLGELNRGFYHAMATMEFGRAGTHYASADKRDLEEFVQFCKEEKRNGKPLIEDPKVRDTLARRAVEVEVTRLIGWSATWWSGERERLSPPRASASSRYYFKVFAERWAKEAMDILGMYGQLRRGSKWAKLAGRIEHNWQRVRSQHAGGTVEVYKNVLAQRGLGLPRPPRPVAAKAEEKK